MRPLITLIAALILLCPLSAVAQIVEVGPGESFIIPRDTKNELILPRLVKLKLKYQRASAIARALGGEVAGMNSPAFDPGYGTLQYLMWDAGIQTVVAYE